MYCILRLSIYLLSIMSWEKEAENDIRLEYASTKDQIADIFTKPLPKDTFESLRCMLGVIPLLTSE